MPAFKRFFRPCAELVTSEGVIANLDGLGLTFEWRIRRTNTNVADQGSIAIYNVSPALSEAIFEAWKAFNEASGYLVTFGIGWDGVPATVLVGDVWKIKPRERTPTDAILKLEIGDGNRVLRDSAVGKSFAGVKIDIVLDYLVNFPPATADAGGGGLGLDYPKESRDLVKAAAAELPIQTWGNIPAGANTREAIDVIMATLGLEWRVHNRQFVVMRGGLSNRPPTILRPSSGLVSYELLDEGGIQLSALANPDVDPGAQIVVQDNDEGPIGAGVYRVESVDFEGSTRGASDMTVIGRKARLL